jgi:hypothetical protein
MIPAFYSKIIRFRFYRQSLCGGFLTDCWLNYMPFRFTLQVRVTGSISQGFKTFAAIAFLREEAALLTMPFFVI